MMDPARQPQQNADVRAAIAKLQATVRRMEAQRAYHIGRRNRRLLILGCSVSLLCHLALMTYFSMVHRAGSGSGGSVAASFHLAILNEQDLTEELEHTGFDELAADPADPDQPSATALELDVSSPAIGAASAAPTAMPTLGATGDGAGGGAGVGDGGGGLGGLGLGGGGGGNTSFFGIGAKGSRFAYIVDISGSMGENLKLRIAMGELCRSIEEIPDYSQFYILLFSYDAVKPPMQKGWTKARRSVVKQFTTWLRQVEPGGGTQPRSSFMHVFSLESRPEIIFFLTDGQFQDISAEEIAALNSRGKKVILNTVQFGDPNGQEVLRKIAQDSGGVYRFVPTGGMQ